MSFQRQTLSSLRLPGDIPALSSPTQNLPANLPLRNLVPRPNLPPSNLLQPSNLPPPIPNLPRKSHPARRMTSTPTLLRRSLLPGTLNPLGPMKTPVVNPRGILREIRCATGTPTEPPAVPD